VVVRLVCGRYGDGLVRGVLGGLYRFDHLVSLAGCCLPLVKEVCLW
jgi:hypothetical protein